MSLRNQYDDFTLNQACLRANSYGGFSYKVVKKICEKGIIDLPVINISYINENVTYVTRDLSEYDKLINLGELK